MTMWHRLIVVAACVLVGTSASAARDPEFITKNSEGREFWVCFMKNFRDQVNVTASPDRLKLQLFLTSSFDAQARIEIDGINYDSTVRIRANTVVNVALPPRVQLRALETPERLAVHITADTAISVYGLNSRYQTTDTYMGLPTSVLGTEYRAIGYTKLSSDLLSALTIIATEDATEVTVTPTATTSSRKRAGSSMKINLRKGDAYTVGALFESIGQCDLTGTLIKSNKKIAVFSGHNCAYVPPKVEACNHLVEQLPPVSSWGKHFYLGNLKERSRYTYRVVADENDTRVFEDTKLVAVLRAGEFYENLNVARHLQVTADKPVMVAQFAQGFKNQDSVGDPMMILVSPTQQFLKQYRFATPINGDWHHYINVVTPTMSISDIRLNGRRIDSSQFVVLGESRYSIAQVQIPYGTHVIKGETPFGLYSYGFGFRGDAYDAYGNMAGQSFLELNKLVDSLPPMAEGKNARDAYVVTFRDDRPMDRGIKSIKVITSTALDATIPKIEPGVPQVTVKISPSTAGATGRIVFKATDVADNSSEYTICYVFDTRSERYVYLLSEGIDAVCAADQAWMVGVYGTIAHSFHTASFSTSGNLTTPGTFGTGQGTGGWAGALVGRRVSQNVVLSARLGVMTVGGSILAADSAVSAIWDTSQGTLIAYQEGTEVSVSAPHITMALMAEYFPERYFYLLGGIQASLPLGSAVDVRRQILRPGNVEFAPGAGASRTVYPSSLSSMSALMLGFVGGIGVSYPVTFSTSVFAEGTYTYMLTDVVNDAPWSMRTLSFNVGARYRW